MTHIKQRRDTFAQWTLVNPVLMDGEAGHERDTGRWKLGDGVTPYIDLPYKSGVDSVAGKVGAVELVVGDIAGAAPLLSPEFTGAPKAATPGSGDDSTRIATTEWVRDREYAPLASPALTGNPTAPTPAVADNDSSIATTQHVKDVLLGSPVLGGHPTGVTEHFADVSTRLATTGFVKSVTDNLGKWIAYNPSISAGSMGSLGILDGKYMTLGSGAGSTVFFEMRIAPGAGFVLNQNTVFGFPIGTAAASSAYSNDHVVKWLDAGSNVYMGSTLIWANGVSTYVDVRLANDYVAAGAFPTWFNAGDVIYVKGSYVRAT